VRRKAWQQRFDEERFRRLLPKANVVQVHLTVDEEVAHRRWARSSRPGMTRGEQTEAKFATGELTWADFTPLDLGVPVYVADTTDDAPVDLARLETFIMTASSGARRCAEPGPFP
jgi:hypothetical protein